MFYFFDSPEQLFLRGLSSKQLRTVRKKATRLVIITLVTASGFVHVFDEVLRQVSTVPPTAGGPSKGHRSRNNLAYCLQLVLHQYHTDCRHILPVPYQAGWLGLECRLLAWYTGLYSVFSMQKMVLEELRNLSGAVLRLCSMFDEALWVCGNDGPKAALDFFTHKIKIHVLEKLTTSSKQHYQYVQSSPQQSLPGHWRQHWTWTRCYQTARLESNY